jgi:beta-glucosidase
VLNVGDEGYSPLFAYGYGLDYTQTDSLGDDLIETYDAPADEKVGRVIYKGAPVAPWVLSLVSDGQVSFVTAATAQSGAVSFRTIDRNVQEDAFRMTTDGSASAGVNLAAKSYFREDLSAEVVNETLLSFAIARQSDLNAPLMLNMSCESEGDAPGSCTHGVDLTPYLSTVEKGEWLDVSIDLGCYADQGIDFSKLVIPFQLVSSAAVTVDVHDISFVKPEGREALIKCN